MWNFIKKIKTKPYIIGTLFTLANLGIALANLHYTGNAYSAQFRPYLGRETIQFLDVDERFNIKIVIKNTGIVPANNVRADIFVITDSEKIKLEFPLNNQSILMPNNSFSMPVNLPYDTKHSSKEILYRIEYDGVTTQGHNTWEKIKFHKGTQTHDLISGHAK